MNWNPFRRLKRRAAPIYPYFSELGPVMVLGPETFIDIDRTVICHKGENYYKPSAGEHAP